MLNTLNHIAIIMDGNRRWAKKNKLDQIEGQEFMDLQKEALERVERYHELVNQNI